MKIIAVDDDELVLELLIESLSKRGFDDITTVGSAQSALDLIEALDADDEPGSFDCFLLDIQMPGIDGIELCRRLRAMPAYSRTPILMVTTHSDREHIEDAFAAGATDYITKPFDEIELGSRIRMADILFKEQRRGLHAYFMSSALRTGSDPKNYALFQTPITVEGVENVVDMLVLENFLLQLSENPLRQSTAIAFKYTDAKDVFDKLSEIEFFKRLETVAEVISKSFGDSEFLAAYFGSGIFIAVMDRAKKPISKDIRIIVNNAAVKAELRSDVARPAIVVGDPVGNPIHRRSDVHTMLLDAILSVVGKSTRSGSDSINVKPLAAQARKYNLFSNK